jgi:hypothetical protein
MEFRLFMSILPNLLRSILITSIFSFTAPILFIGGIWGSLVIIGVLPGLAIVREVGVEQVAQFLAEFGNGSSAQGLLVIGLVCSLVGVLFDTFTFYRHQNLRDG